MGVLPVFIGIDPGKKGGIAVVDGSGDMLIARAMPCRKDGEIDAAALRALLKFATDDVVCGIVILEKAQAMPKQGVTAVFTYGVGYGKIKAVLELLELPVEEVRPNVWKKALGLTTKLQPRTMKETNKECVARTAQRKYAGKIRAVELAGQLFPAFNPYRYRGGLRDGEAEALLLAEWGRRKAEKI